MEMNFAELLLLLTLALGIYIALRPLRRRMEGSILRILKKLSSRKGGGRIINITPTDRDGKK